MSQSAEASIPPDPLNDLLPLLQRLDLMLENAIAAAHQAYDPDSTDPHRGLHVTEADVERLLARQPGTPAFLGYGELSTEVPPDLVPPGSRLAWLQQTFHLSSFDLDVVAIALAPELDRRYERLYIYLQDDVRGQRPTVDLALNLLCADASTKLRRRHHFATDAPLVRQGLVHLVAAAKPSTLLAQELHLDAAVTRFLLGQPGLAARLAPSCRLLSPGQEAEAALGAAVSVDPSLVRLIDQTSTPLRLYFHGPIGEPNGAPPPPWRSMARPHSSWQIWPGCAALKIRLERTCQVCFARHGCSRLFCYWTVWMRLKTRIPWPIKRCCWS
ncbi:MAG: hypothetical protein HC929_02340 [Leptolyngbyaceae cyanobacterium SM2_5_2]|nr:hypothetical protein [Leptolyngbyaceae cyanobacterium SM2_5_2]